MKFTITPEDIKNGDVRSCEGCPVALGVKRATGKRTIVSPHSMMILDNPKEMLSGRVYQFPKEITKVINTYDRTGKMQPFTMELRED